MEAKQSKLYMFVVYTSQKPKQILPKYYYLILSGAFKKTNYSTLRDDVGDNVSHENPYLAEYSSLYWIWKNTDKIQKNDYIGLSHYRRFFIPARLLPFVLKEKQARKLLNENDIILTKEKIHKFSIRDFLINTLTPANEKVFEDTLQNKYPEYWLTAKKILNGNSFGPCNLFVCKKALFEEYMTFYFSFINAIKPNINMSILSPWQKRIFGYMGEVLLNIWAETVCKKIVRLPYKTRRSIKRLFYKILPKKISSIFLKQNLFENGADTSKHE